MIRRWFPWNNRPYTTIGWIQAPAGDGEWRYTLCIRINGRLFFITLFKSNFENSPARLKEFIDHTAAIHDNDTPSEDEDSDNEDNERGYISPEDREACFDWAIGPYLDIFQHLAPPPANITILTLAEVYHPDSYECQLRAIDDRLVPGPVDKRKTQSQHMGELQDYGPSRHAPPPTTYPLFRLAEIQVLDEGWEENRDLQNLHVQEVRVYGRDLCLSRPSMPRDSQYDVEAHEKIASAHFSSEVRVAALFGLVLDDEGNLFGYLLEGVASGDSLTNAYHSHKAPLEKWIRQIETTVKALHEIGVFWGEADAYNVAIDDEDNAWVTNLRKPYVSSWDMERGVTAQSKDLKGLQGIRKLLTDRMNLY